MRARGGPPLRGRRATPRRHGTCGGTCGFRGCGCKGILRLTLLQGRRDPLGCRRRRREPRATRTPCTAPRRGFFQDPQWADLADWEARARAPLRHGGAHARPRPGRLRRSRRRRCCASLRTRARRARTRTRKTNVGVFFGEPGVTVADPFFGGEGPPRPGCVKCGRCMIGCQLQRQEHAGQELPLPGRATRRTHPARADGGRRRRRSAHRTAPDGYRVTSELPGRWVRKDAPAAHRARRRARRGCARHEPAAPELPRRAARCRASRIGSGYLVRTNSRGAAGRDRRRPQAWTSPSGSRSRARIYPDPDTHIETVTYGGRGQLDGPCCSRCSSARGRA